MKTNQARLSNNPVFSTLTVKQMEHVVSEHIGVLEGISEALSLIHISEPTRPSKSSRMPSSA